MPDYTSRYYVATLRFSYLGRRASKRDHSLLLSRSRPLDFPDKRAFSFHVPLFVFASRNSFLFSFLLLVFDDEFVYRGREYRKSRGILTLPINALTERVYSIRRFSVPRAINAIASRLLRDPLSVVQAAISPADQDLGRSRGTG